MSVIAVCAAAKPSWAAEVTVTNSASTTVTYTDNVDLDPDDEAEEAIIWTNTGATTVRAVGARAEAAIDAALSLDTTFEDETEVDLRPTVRGLGSIELIEDHFFIDGRASARTVLESPFSAVSASPGSGNDDLDTVYTIGVSPYLLYGFGNWAESQLRYRHDRVYADEDEDTEETVSNFIGLNTATGTRFTRFIVSNDLEYENVASDGDDGEFERSTALLSGQYVLIRQFSLLGSIGYENINSDDFRDDPDGVIWNAGFYAQPGPRSEFRFTYGKRYGGDDVAAMVSYLVTSRLTFQANYSESVTTTSSQIGIDEFGFFVDEQGRIIDPRTGLPVDEFDLDFGLQDQTYIANRFDASLVGNYGRSTFVLATAYEKRNFDFVPDEELYTASGRWTYELSPDTRLGTVVAYRASKEASPGDLDQDTVLGRVEVSHDLAENMQAIASYSRSDRWAEEDSDEYSENAVTLGLRMTF